MSKVIFEPYNPEKPFIQQHSNVAFVMLNNALVKTQERPEQPKRAGEWISMVRLMEAFASLEYVVRETVMTEEGPRVVEIGMLKPEGGEMELDEDSINLLNKIWEAHVERNLNFSHARQVVITREFLKNINK